MEKGRIEETEEKGSYTAKRGVKLFKKKGI